jgi:hypothetical protein
MVCDATGRDVRFTFIENCIAMKCYTSGYWFFSKQCVLREIVPFLDECLGPKTGPEQALTKKEKDMMVKTWNVEFMDIPCKTAREGGAEPKELATVKVMGDTDLEAVANATLKAYEDLADMMDHPSRLKVRAVPFGG